MTTIKDVAEFAGVSVATVSRTLNNSGYVGEESRKKVERAIKTLEYYPNEVARSLFQKTSKMIGLLLPDISNPYFPLLAKGVEDYAQEKGYMVILGNVEDNLEKEKSYVKFFSQYNVSGVLSASAIQKDAKSTIPFVLLDREMEKEDYSISTDDLLGGKLAAKAIKEARAESVIVMAGPKKVPGANDRLTGNLQILNRSNINYKIFETNTYQVDKAEKIARSLFETFENFDSVIASNDVYALAVMKEAMRRGYRIPQDIQIIGYDDMPFSRYMFPGLTTIAQPAYEVGHRGAKMLFNLIERKSIIQKRVILKPDLVCRDTLR